MKSLSAMRFSPDCPLTKHGHDFTKQESDENNSPDIKSMKQDNDSSSSSSNYSSSSSSSNSPPPHPVLPPPLLPLVAFPDHPPPLLPLLSFVPGRLGHPIGNGTSFLTFPQPSNGTSFMPFHHPASVFLRQQQAALAYSYAIIHHQHQQQQMLQQKQLNENRFAIFRPHELSDHQHGINSSAELSYYLHKIVPHDYNDLRLNRGKVYQSTTPVLTDQSPIDLRKISSLGDDSTRYNSNNNHHQQQFVHATPKKNPTSGKKLIGIRFLFPPFADHVTLYERAKIWVARHEYKYFVDWSSDDLLKVDLDLRPIHPITRQQYKIHMNRSEFCRNVKLKFCLQTDSPWAKDFCEKLQKSPAEGGFTGLCQAKIAAADLWRTYSENYRSHQARQPNGTSLKTFGNPKTTSNKKRSLVADENTTIKKCAKMDSLAVLSDKFTSKQIDEQDSDLTTDQSKLRNNNYYYYYYHQHHNDLKFQVSRDSMGERKVTNHEMSLRESSPGRHQDQSNCYKMSDNEDEGNEVKTNKSSSRESELQKPTIWKPFLKTKFNDDDRKQLPIVGDEEKYFEAKNQNVVVKGRCEIGENISNEDIENKKMEVEKSEPKICMEKIINRSPSNHNLHQQPRNFTNPYDVYKSFSSRILQKFGNRIFDLRSEDYQNSMNHYRSNVNNNKKNFTLEYKQLNNKCDIVDEDDDDDDDVRHATNLDEMWSSIKHNQSKELWDKFIQSDKVATSSSLSNNPESTNQDEEGGSKEGRSFKPNLFLLDKIRSVQHREPINSLRIDADQPKKDNMRLVNSKLNHQLSPNESSNHHVTSSRIIDQSDESDNEVNVVDADENYK